MSKFKTKLDEAQLERLKDTFRRIVLSGGSGDHWPLAEKAVAVLVEEAKGGDKSADALIEALAVDGCAERALWGFVKEDTTLLGYRQADGTVGTKETPSRVGVRRRRGDGSAYHQQEFWWTLSWREYAQFRDRERAIIARYQLKGRGFDEVDKLHERHPETKTPGEACEIEGIDPRSFVLHVA